MRLHVLNRKLHYWASAFVALPILVILLSGLLLQAKKHWAWVQPPELRGTGTSPEVDLEGILAAVRDVSHLSVRGWNDINRLDIRPNRGMAKVWLHNGWEVQVDLGTGLVLQSAFRRSDLIEAIHDGSFFAGDFSRYGVFLPSAIVLPLLWLTGVWMFCTPIVNRRRRKTATGARRAP